MKTYIALIIILFFCLRQNAQTTAIPDANFEQALIYFGIDSDGTINGQVLTSDINTITELDISDRSIGALTGIEDFSSLEILNCSDNNLATLDLSNNSMLKELYAGNPSELPENYFSSIDLSNNSLLERVWLNNIPTLEFINLKNGNNSLLTYLEVTCYIEGASCSTELCVEVDDEQAANNNQPPYSSWIRSSLTTLTENCNLNTDTENLKEITFYPNPTKDILFIENSSEIESLQLFNVNGKLLKSWKGIQLEKISLSDLTRGIYFVKAASNRNNFVKKIIKL